MLEGNPPEKTTLNKRTGGNIVVKCSFDRSERWKYFCRDECTGDGVLIKTTENRVEKDRYSIEYVEGSSAGGLLFVNITQLITSDSGQYRCGMGQSQSQEFEVTVTDGEFPLRKNEVSVCSFLCISVYLFLLCFLFTDPITSKPNLSLPTFPTSVPSASTPTTTQSLTSESDQQSETSNTGTPMKVYLNLFTFKHQMCSRIPINKTSN